MMKALASLRVVAKAAVASAAATVVLRASKEAKRLADQALDRLVERAGRDEPARD